MASHELVKNKPKQSGDGKDILHTIILVHSALDIVEIKITGNCNIETGTTSLLIALIN